MDVNIIALAGSTRTDSLNRKLLSCAVSAIEAAGGSADTVELKDFPLPIYDGDFESAEGIPRPANELYERFKAMDAILMASPEYNSSISPLLKNTIDWVSRPHDGDPPLAAFAGKVAGLISASPGQLGGLRGLVHVRSILGNIGMHVIPQQVAVPAAHTAFDDDGGLRDAKLASRIAELANALVMTAKGIKQSR